MNNISYVSCNCVIIHPFFFFLCSSPPSAFSFTLSFMTKNTKGFLWLILIRVYLYTRPKIFKEPHNLNMPYTWCDQKVLRLQWKALFVLDLNHFNYPLPSTRCLKIIDILWDLMVVSEESILFRNLICWWFLIQMISTFDRLNHCGVNG